MTFSFSSKRIQYFHQHSNSLFSTTSSGATSKPIRGAVTPGRSAQHGATNNSDFSLYGKDPIRFTDSIASSQSPHSVRQYLAKREDPSITCRTGVYGPQSRFARINRTKTYANSGTGDLCLGIRDERIYANPLNLIKVAQEYILQDFPRLSSTQRLEILEDFDKWRNLIIKKGGGLYPKNSRLSGTNPHPFDFPLDTFQATVMGVPSGYPPIWLSIHRLLRLTSRIYFKRLTVYKVGTQDSIDYKHKRCRRAIWRGVYALQSHWNVKPRAHFRDPFVNQPQTIAEDATNIRKYCPARGQPVFHGTFFDRRLANVENPTGKPIVTVVPDETFRLTDEDKRRIKPLSAKNIPLSPYAVDWSLTQGCHKVIARFARYIYDVKIEIARYDLNDPSISKKKIREFLFQIGAKLLVESLLNRGAYAFKTEATNVRGRTYHHILEAIDTLFTRPLSQLSRDHFVLEDNPTRFVPKKAKHFRITRWNDLSDERPVLLQKGFDLHAPKRTQSEKEIAVKYWINFIQKVWPVRVRAPVQYKHTLLFSKFPLGLTAAQAELHQKDPYYIPPQIQSHVYWRTLVSLHELQDLFYRPADARKPRATFRIEALFEKFWGDWKTSWRKRSTHAATVARRNAFLAQKDTFKSQGRVLFDAWLQNPLSIAALRKESNFLSGRSSDTYKTCNTGKKIDRRYQPSFLADTLKLSPRSYPAPINVWHGFNLRFIALCWSHLYDLFVLLEQAHKKGEISFEEEVTIFRYASAELGLLRQQSNRTRRRNTPKELDFADIWADTNFLWEDFAQQKNLSSTFFLNPRSNPIAKNDATVGKKGKYEDTPPYGWFTYLAPFADDVGRARKWNKFSPFLESPVPQSKKGKRYRKGPTKGTSLPSNIYVKLHFRAWILKLICIFPSL